MFMSLWQKGWHNPLPSHQQIGEQTEIHRNSDFVSCAVQIQRAILWANSRIALPNPSCAFSTYDYFSPVLQ